MRPGYAAVMALNAAGLARALSWLMFGIALAALAVAVVAADLCDQRRTSREMP